MSSSASIREKEKNILRRAFREGRPGYVALVQEFRRRRAQVMEKPDSELLAQYKTGIAGAVVLSVEASLPGASSRVVWDDWGPSDGTLH